MPQEFNVLSCYSCTTFQVDQVKKSTNKWTCKICHEKQSIKQVFFRGTGKECRLWVQEKNMIRGKMQHAVTVQSMNPETDNGYKDYEEEFVNIHSKEETEMPGQDQFKGSKWEMFLPDVKEDKNEAVDDADLPNWTTERDIYKKSMKSRQVANKRQSKSFRYKPYLENKIENNLMNASKNVIFSNQETEKKTFTTKVNDNMGEVPAKYAKFATAPMFGKSQNIIENKENPDLPSTKMTNKSMGADSPKSKPVASKWTQFLSATVDSEEDID